MHCCEDNDDDLPVSYTHLDVYKRQPCQLLPTLMVAFDSDAETSVSINSRPGHSSPANNVFKYMQAGRKILRNSNLFYLQSYFI